MNISKFHIISFSLIIHAFALLNLIKNDFSIFILLVLTSFYLPFIIKPNTDTEKSYEYYNRIAEGIKVFSLFYLFYITYEQKINITTFLIVFMVFLGAHLRFSIKNTIKVKEEEKIDKVLELWTIPYKNISLEKLKEIKKYLVLFKERYIMFYIICLMIIIHLN